MLFRFALLLLIAFVMTGCGNQSSQAPASDTTKNKWETAPVPAPTTSAQAYPRYQIVFSPHLRADTFLLDTQKGRIWKSVKFSDVPEQPDTWDEMDIIDSQGEIGMTLIDFLKAHPAPVANTGIGKKQP